MMKQGTQDRDERRDKTMQSRLTWGNEHIQLEFTWGSAQPVFCSAISADGVELGLDGAIPVVEILCSHTERWHVSDRLVHTEIGAALRYRSHITYHQQLANGVEVDVLVLSLAAEDYQIEADLTLTLPSECAMFRAETAVYNRGRQDIAVESVTSWCSTIGAGSHCGEVKEAEARQGNSAWATAWSVIEGQFDWLAEGRWQERKLTDLFPALSNDMTGRYPRGSYHVSSSSTWSTAAAAPMFMLEASPRFDALTEQLRQMADGQIKSAGQFAESRTRLTAGTECQDQGGPVWVAQIEHSGPWRWEIGDLGTDGYFALAGPNQLNHSWMHILAPEESFTSVPVSVGIAANRYAAMRELTTYRRNMRERGSKKAYPRVIFNDYMNTINGDPTTAALMPLVQAAGEVGCDVFVMDCGWYADDGDWWDTVGQWIPSRWRFPGKNGLREVTDAIRRAGMIPGLWIEPDVVGVNSPIAHTLPDSAFLQRSGRRIVEQGRYQFDFRSDVTQQYMRQAVERLIADFDIGYFKFDYNVTAGVGTDYQADSLGDGLLEHVRAYYHWLSALRQDHPELMIENCASGGMRQDFGVTSRTDVQSTSDQQDWRLYPPITASAAMLVPPEQAGNWAYPHEHMDRETFAFATSATLLGNFYLSGYINRMEHWQRDMLRQAMDAYRGWIRPLIGQSYPWWPLGLPCWDSDVVAYGLADGRTYVLTVWARQSEREEIVIAPPNFVGEQYQVHTVFPSGPDLSQWDVEVRADGLHIRLPRRCYAARTFAITVKGEDGTFLADTPVC
ncbi:glycoside hydrolase family 36 protein [Trueperella sp. LYQ141]|uniref:glycoside hydrolase family 36 protein n=1 Tax=Trueperella sp. LYQ141 TaxID=3391058 RepID=UPI003983BB35